MNGIKLYELIQNDSIYIDPNYDFIDITGPRAFIIDDSTIDADTPYPYYQEFSSYKFSKIPAGGCEFLVKNKEKDSSFKKFNYKFMFYVTECDDKNGCNEFLEREGYVFLNNKDERRLNYLWGKRWFQQNDNAKWLITIIISAIFSIFTTLITLYIKK